MNSTTKKTRYGDTPQGYTNPQWEKSCNRAHSREYNARKKDFVNEEASKPIAEQRTMKDFSREVKVHLAALIRDGKIQENALAEDAMKAAQANVDLKQYLMSHEKANKKRKRDDEDGEYRERKAKEAKE